MGFIIMEAADTPPMSGSNTICGATVLLETRILPMLEPQTRFLSGRNSASRLARSDALSGSRSTARGA